MSHILHLDASARAADSHSRRVSQDFLDAWLAKHPSDTVTTRDIGHQAIPHVTEAYINAMYTSADALTPDQKDVLKLSEELIAELKAADILVFGIPMYNFGVPSVFKAYIDQVVRAGVTFNPADYSGLLPGKKLFVVTARGGGGYGDGEARAAYNQQDGQIRTAFSFMGITDIEFIHVENTSNTGEIRTTSLQQAHAKIEAATA